MYLAIIINLTIMQCPHRRDSYEYNYSTVVDDFPTLSLRKRKNIPQSGHYLVVVVRFTSSNLWMSPYSLHQQHLFNIIREQHEQGGKNFQQITDYLIEEGFKTPRGKDFTNKHTWSIYTKKKRSIERFSRSYTPKIKLSFSMTTKRNFIILM